MEKHFVIFYSPGTFVHETSTQEIPSWDVDAAVEMARNVTERYGARPFGFRFSTRSRGPEDLDSRETRRSPMHFLGGRTMTLEEVEAEADPNNKILIGNMRRNRIERVVRNDNSWRSVHPLNDGDVVLPFDPQPWP